MAVNAEERRISDLTDFSITDCGAMDRLMVRLGISRPPDARYLVRRAIAAALIAWLPLLALASFAGHEGARPAISFLHDIAVHVRFILVVPLLVLAEAAIGQRTRLVAAGFLTSGLVTEPDAPRFQSAVRSTRKLVDSIWVEIVLLVLTYVLVWFAIQSVKSDGVLVWFERAAPGGHRLTLAGWWYALVSVPLASFLFLRWLWRYLVWTWFLHRLSRLRLRLVASHPDRAGGLGFINVGHAAFAVIAVAAGAVVSAAAANRILYEGASLRTYQSAIIGFIVIAVVVGIAPLLSFMRPLILTKRRGLVEYGDLATRYVQSFERKWVSGGGDSKEPLLGTGDIQSLADLGGSFERVDHMKVMPFDRRTVMAFAFSAAAPMLPLLLTVMPLSEMIRFLLKAMI
ncbi:MAG TPA: hypothetical protein VEC56_06350 [Candidatus Krumholzibacteria bacterium]|nr:hypothetical protein [Candidatus Krumholzibacteria bacterium]